MFDMLSHTVCEDGQEHHQSESEDLRYSQLR